MYRPCVLLCLCLVGYVVIKVSINETKDLTLWFTIVAIELFLQLQLAFLMVVSDC